ncbi:MAG: Lrp/AsnC family transcriptional regulator [Clostridia bacterium]|nr:Lrp/AsnC family transcriptional regulator [Clostridia bacterium]
MTVLEKDILNILAEDARMSAKKIAAMLSVEEEQVKNCIAAMEKNGVLVKYTAIVNSEKADESLVEALIEVKVSPKKKEGFDGIAKQIAAFPEVKAVYLMSGAYDLAVFIEDATLQKVARFVSERISTFDGVISTATHFILKKYKIEGVLTEKEDADYRLSVQA